MDETGMRVVVPVYFVVFVSPLEMGRDPFAEGHEDLEPPLRLAERRVENYLASKLGSKRKLPRWLEEVDQQEAYDAAEDEEEVL